MRPPGPLELAAHVDAGDAEAAVAVGQHEGLEGVDLLLRTDLEPRGDNAVSSCYSLTVEPKVLH